MLSMSVEAAVAAAPQLEERLPSRLPPGPQLPRWVLTFGFLLGGPRFLELCRRRYGGAVYMRTVFDEGFVMLFDPPLVRQVFHGPQSGSTRVQRTGCSPRSSAAARCSCSTAPSTSASAS